MSDPIIHSGFVLSDTSTMSITQLAEATNLTFTGYFFPVQHTPHSFARFCSVFHLDLGASVLLRHEEGAVAGLTMLGIRGIRGWCGGFGIVPEFRRRGLSADLIAGFVAQGRKLGLKTLHLEVLTQNASAIHVYRKAGFEVVRDVLILSAETAQVASAVNAHPARDTYDVRTLTLEEALLAMPRVEAEMEPVYTWQRELASLLVGKNVQCRLATLDDRPRALLIYRVNPVNGQIGIDRCVFSEPPAARALLAHAIEETAASSDADKGGSAFSVLNEPEGSPLLLLLTSLGFQETHRQHDMRLAL